MNNIYYQRPNNSRKQENIKRNNPQEQTKQEYMQQEERYMSLAEQEKQYYRPSYEEENVPSVNKVVVRKQNGAKEVLINIVLAVLSVTFVVACLTLCTELMNINKKHIVEADSFWWKYDNGMYADSVKIRYSNQYCGAEETTDMKQCYAVADYFEAASMYKVAVFTGKTDKVQEYLEIMEKKRDEMGDVSYLAKDINTRLGLEVAIE